MDLVMADIEADDQQALSEVQARLTGLVPHCAWTSGRWPVIDCEWNELQNTSQDKRRLAEYLVDQYRRLP